MIKDMFVDNETERVSYEPNIEKNERLDFVINKDLHGLKKYN